MASRRNSAQARARARDTDISDTVSFASKRWEDAVFAAKPSLSISNADWEKIKERRDWKTAHLDIERKAADPNILPKDLAVKKRLLNHIQPLPRTLGNLLSIFTESINPALLEFNVLWGMLDLNITLSCTSIDKLNRTVRWMKQLRNMVELFNRSVDVCEDVDEVRYAILDVLESLLQIFGESIRHLRNCPTDDAAKKQWWNALETKIHESIAEIDAAVRYLSKINSISMVVLERRVAHLPWRHKAASVSEEPSSLPIMIGPMMESEMLAISSSPGTG